MSDDGGHIHMGTAHVNHTPTDPKQFGGMATAILMGLMWLGTSGLKTALRFGVELYLFLFRRRRYHWTTFISWMLYSLALYVAVGEVTRIILRTHAAPGFWRHAWAWLNVLGSSALWLAGSLSVAGLLAKVMDGIQFVCERLGGWLAWYPLLGYRSRSGAFKPMFGGSASAAPAVVVAQATQAAPTPQAPAYLPMPAHQPFALGAANVGENVLRGTKVVDGYAYRQDLEANQRQQGKGGLDSRLVTIGAVPMAFGSETQHLMISGKTGAGKSQAINSILRTARNLRGNAALIADPAGGYLARFGRDDDHVLNPFDLRSEHWSPFAEIQFDYDCATLARATIPDGEGSSAEWNHYAQALLTEVLKALWKSGEKDPTRVLYYCASAAPDELAKLLAGTTAAVLTQRENARMLGNVRGIISTYMGAWQYLRPDGDFSVRRFVRESDDNGGAWLFMTYTDAQMSMLKYLIALWMELAVVEGLGLTESDDRRLWIVLDELDSLGKISSLKAGLTKLRKYGVPCICGIQTIAQLRATYGRDDAQTLLSCMATKLLLPAGDNETAEYLARELGEQEIERLQKSEGESQKVGFAEFDRNKSSNSHMHRQVQQAVLPSQLMALPNLHGYLRMPGTDVYQVVIPFERMADLNLAFEPAHLT